MLMPFRYLIKKPKQGEKMDNSQELKAHLQDSNKARMYEEKKMEKKEIRKELQSILKDYHYNSDTENMSKDVVVALENLVGGLK